MVPTHPDQPRLILIDALWEDDDCEIRGGIFSFLAWPAALQLEVEDMPDRITDIRPADPVVHGEDPVGILERLSHWIGMSDCVQCEDPVRDIGAVNAACDLLGIEQPAWPLAASFLGSLVLTGAPRRRLT